MRHSYRYLVQTLCGVFAVALLGNFATAQSGPTKTVAAAKTETPVMVGGYLSVGFDRLASFDYAASDAPVTNLTTRVDAADKFIPNEIKALNGKKVVISGFMMPLEVHGETATEFLILRNQSSCCFGAAPKLNEFVMVKVPKGVNSIMDQVVNIAGILHVGTTRENGYITQIYQMDGDKMLADTH
jgi:hypothetical protein